MTEMPKNHNPNTGEQRDHIDDLVDQGVGSYGQVMKMLDESQSQQGVDSTPAQTEAAQGEVVRQSTEQTRREYPYDRSHRGRNARDVGSVASKRPKPFGHDPIEPR